MAEMAEAAEEERAGIRVVKKKHVDRLLGWPNVTAVDINHRTVGGQETDKICLVIWVKNKKPESEIPPNEILPKEIDGVPVDVFQGEAKLGEGFSWPAETQSIEEEQSNVPELEAQEVLNLRPLDTLRGGDSLAPNTATYAGTLGYFVTKKNAIGILSNAHVMRGIGDMLISPAKMDGGKPVEDYIGTVKNTVISTAVDCAYAPLRGKITKFKLKDGTSVTGTQAAAVGTQIKYYGRTSNAVTSVVVSLDWSGVVSGKTYHDQIMIYEGVQPGDSGSLLVDRNENTAIGLNFAEAGGHGLANRIQDVLAALGVEIAI